PIASGPNPLVTARTPTLSAGLPAAAHATAIRLRASSSRRATAAAVAPLVVSLTRSKVSICGLLILRCAFARKTPGGRVTPLRKAPLDDRRSRVASKARHERDVVHANHARSQELAGPKQMRQVRARKLLACGARAL